jgi:uncharacterized membrane protein YhaH (DUF805 family)
MAFSTVADELERLASLKKRGILSQEEFDTERRKLLARPSVAGAKPAEIAAHQPASVPIGIPPPDTVAGIFFGFSGRISRSTFWIANLVLIIISIVITISITSRSVADDLLANGYQNAIFVFIVIHTGLYLIVLYSSLAVGTKRWHDRSKSGWWNLIWLTPSFCVPVAFYFDIGAALQAILLLALVIGGLWSLIENGFLRGMDGANHFGADPLAN